jgi:hypothetical protein
MSKAPPKDSGICFPRNAKGERSTSDAGKAIIAAAIRGSKAPEADKLASACEKEKNWRFGYNKHFKNLVKVSATSPAAALGAAESGINAMHTTFDFVEPGTTDVVSFDKYLSQFKSTPSNRLNTAVISGKAKREAKPLSVQYRGKTLSGKALQTQFNKWADYGTIEPDAAASLSSVCEGNIDLTNQHFVLIGAGSAMGPFYKLLEHGATVICIDIPGKWGERPAAMWQRLIDAARASSGTIIFPLTGVTQAQCKDDAALIAAAGVNLTDMPATILDWLKNTAVGNALCVGNYTYLDGDLHVKLALAADAIIAGLCKARKDTKVAFLCTPTDLHVITDDAHKAAVANYGWHPGRLVELVFQLLSFGKFLRKNACSPLPTEKSGKTLKIVDGLSVAQGPNYALAKRLQHWRAQVAYQNGHTVSSNIAPSTATLSVVSNRTFGWAYGGMPYFQPYEIFQQDTTNGVMGAMLIYDVTNTGSAANPSNRSKFSIENTLELFKWNSVHGGVWRAAYTVDSIGEVSVLIHFLGGPKVFLPVLTLLLGLAVLAYMKFTGKLPAL